MFQYESEMNISSSELSQLEISHLAEFKHYFIQLKQHFIHTDVLVEQLENEQEERKRIEDENISLKKQLGEAKRIRLQSTLQEQCEIDKQLQKLKDELLESQTKLSKLQLENAELQEELSKYRRAIKFQDASTSMSPTRTISNSNFDEMCDAMDEKQRNFIHVERSKSQTKLKKAKLGVDTRIRGKRATSEIASISSDIEKLLENNVANKSTHLLDSSDESKPNDDSNIFSNRQKELSPVLSSENNTVIDLLESPITNHSFSESSKQIRRSTRISKLKNDQLQQIGVSLSEKPMENMSIRDIFSSLMESDLSSGVEEMPYPVVKKVDRFKTKANKRLSSTPLDSSQSQCKAKRTEINSDFSASVSNIDSIITDIVSQVATAVPIKPSASQSHFKETQLSLDSNASEKIHSSSIDVQITDNVQVKHSHSQANLTDPQLEEILMPKVVSSISEIENHKKENSEMEPLQSQSKLKENEVSIDSNPCELVISNIFPLISDAGNERIENIDIECHSQSKNTVIENQLSIDTNQSEEVLLSNIFPENQEIEDIQLKLPSSSQNKGNENQLIKNSNPCEEILISSIVPSISANKKIETDTLQLQSKILANELRIDDDPSQEILISSIVPTISDIDNQIMDDIEKEPSLQSQDVNENQLRTGSFSNEGTLISNIVPVISDIKNQAIENIELETPPSHIKVNQKQLSLNVKTNPDPTSKIASFTSGIENLITKNIGNPPVIHNREASPKFKDISNVIDSFFSQMDRLICNNFEVKLEDKIPPNMLKRSLSLNFESYSKQYVKRAMSAHVPDIESQKTSHMLSDILPESSSLVSLKSAFNDSKVSSESVSLSEEHRTITPDEDRMEDKPTTSDLSLQIDTSADYNEHSDSNNFKPSEIKSSTSDVQPICSTPMSMANSPIPAVHFSLDDSMQISEIEFPLSKNNPVKQSEIYSDPESSESGLASPIITNVSHPVRIHKQTKRYESPLRTTIGNRVIFIKYMPDNEVVKSPEYFITSSKMGVRHSQVSAKSYLAALITRFLSNKESLQNVLLMLSTEYNVQKSAYFIEAVIWVMLYLKDLHIDFSSCVYARALNEVEIEGKNLVACSEEKLLADLIVEAASKCNMLKCAHVDVCQTLGREILFGSSSIPLMCVFTRMLFLLHQKKKNCSIARVFIYDLFAKNPPHLSIVLMNAIGTFPKAFSIDDAFTNTVKSIVRHSLKDSEVVDDNRYSSQLEFCLAKICKLCFDEIIPPSEKCKDLFHSLCSKKFHQLTPGKNKNSLCSTVVYGELKSIELICRYSGRPFAYKFLSRTFLPAIVNVIPKDRRSADIKCSPDLIINGQLEEAKLSTALTMLLGLGKILAALANSPREHHFIEDVIKTVRDVFLVHGKESPDISEQEADRVCLVCIECLLDLTPICAESAFSIIKEIKSMRDVEIPSSFSNRFKNISQLLERVE